MEKEYCEIYKNHSFFNGSFTREKLIILISLKEKEGWRYLGNKASLKIGSFGMGLGDSDLLFSKIVAILEREKNRRSS
ncbi:MAG: hypothetical protein KAT17_03345 [Candidatus Aminicenantes bacterium]|nr:hypothetical protein [Candidatus Aminicenantes bacterium]